MRSDVSHSLINGVNFSSLYYLLIVVLFIKNLIRLEILISLIYFVNFILSV